jgi:F420-dependent oxidoreductase-like protein
MRMGLMIGAPAEGNGVDGFIAEVKRSADEGFASVWTPQLMDADAVTLCALAGREVPGIELGTAVVPTYPRHPLALASHALTAQAACRGRFVLGVGLSHQVVIESAFGLSFEKPIRHMEEYLAILRPALRGEQVAFHGEVLSATTFAPVRVSGAEPCPVLIAALGPRMLKLAGEVADGTITWMTGPATLADHIVPEISRAASAAGRPAPRIVSGLPVCVTEDADAARQHAAKAFAIYGHLPSYRAMLDREGAAGPADVAIVGSEADVAKAVEALADAGVTDFIGALFGNVEQQTRTRQLLLSMR